MSHHDAFLLKRLFFSFEHPFLWDLPDEFAYGIYYFTIGLLGTVTKEKRIPAHLNVIKHIREVMKRIEERVKKISSWSIILVITCFLVRSKDLIYFKLHYECWKKKRETNDRTDRSS